jgi:NADPH2:quinone reductase
MRDFKLSDHRVRLAWYLPNGLLTISLALIHKNLELAGQAKQSNYQPKFISSFGSQNAANREYKIQPCHLYRYPVQHLRVLPPTNYPVQPSSIVHYCSVNMSQNALLVTKIGSPLIKTTRAIPQPKEGQLLVKVKVAGLNPHDAKSLFTGIFIKNSLPSPLATDIVGTVSSVGANVTDFKVGDKVLTFGNPMLADATGTQEFAIGTAKHTAKVPEGINDDEAATLTLNPLTAFVGLFFKDGMDIPPPAPFYGNQPDFDYGKLSLLVVGGGSAVGKYIISYAKYAGFGKIVTIASKGKSEKELRDLGATHIIDRHLDEKEIESQIHDIVGDDLQYVYDAVNVGQAQEVGARSLSSSKPGKLISISGGDFDESAVPGKKAGFVRKGIYAGTQSSPELINSYWAALPKLIVDGVLKPTPYSVIDGLDVDKVNQVLKDYQDGKHVVKPQIHIA